MKKIYTIMSVLLLLPLVLQAQDQRFTLTTSRAVGETLSLTVNRTLDDLVIDWGDGVAVTYTHESAPLREITGTLKGQTITVSGSKYLHTLICEGQDLTAVNFSNAPNMKSLYLSHNALTALSLTAIGSNLQDLDCSYNELRSLSLTATRYPNMEIINVSNNDLGSISGTTAGTNYVGAFANLQYLDISHNGRIKQAVVSSNNELDYLNCAGNVLTRLTLPSSGRLTTIDAAQNSLTALDVTPFTGLLQIDVTGNSLTELDLSNTKVVKDVFAADNELTNVSFTTRGSRDTLNICDLRNNRVFFSSLPRSASKVRYLNVYPQRPFPLTTEMGFKQGSVDVDGTTYTALYVTQNPSYATRTNSDYIVNLNNLRYDGNGNARNTISILDVSTPDTTALTQYLVSAGAGDYTVTGVNYTFLTEHKSLVICLTHNTGFYQNYKFYSEPFTINEPTATAIDRVTLDNNGQATDVYDLQGRRVLQPTHGLYIIGGKKVYIK